MFDNLVAGTRIIGVGDPRHSDAPKFTWQTAITASWTVDKADVTIQGLHLDFTGIDAVTNCINVTAAGLTFANNFCLVEDSGGQPVKVFGSPDSADKMRIINNEFIGEEGGGTPILLDLDDANAGDDILFANNLVDGDFNNTNGIINVAGAVKRLKIINCLLTNRTTSSTRTVHVADVASSGTFLKVYSHTMNDGVGTAQGILFAGTTNPVIACIECYNADENGKNGVLSPAALAT